MKTAVTRFVLVVALLTGVAAVPAAQRVVRRVEQQTPLDATDPLAVRSAALVKLILAGEKTPASRCCARKRTRYNADKKMAGFAAAKISRD